MSSLSGEQNGSFSIFFFFRIFDREGKVVHFDPDHELFEEIDHDLCNEVLYNEGIDFQYTSSSFQLIFNEGVVTEDREYVNKNQMIDLFNMTAFDIYLGERDWVYQLHIEEYQIEEDSFEMKEPDVE